MTTEAPTNAFGGRFSLLFGLTPDVFPGVPRLPEHRGPLGALRDFARDRISWLADVERTYGPLAVARFATTPLLVVSAPDLAHEVLATRAAEHEQDRAFRVLGRTLLGRGVLTSPVDVHDAQRRKVAPAFVHKRVAAFAPIAVEHATRTAASWRDGEVVGVAREASKAALAVLTEAIFKAEGADVADTDAVTRSITVAMEQMVDTLNSGLPIPPGWPTPGNLRAKRAVAEIDAIVTKIIERRGGVDAPDRGDFLSVLLANAKGGGPEAEALLRDEARTFYVAGHETTANGVAWTLHLLGEHPEIRAKVEAEVDALLDARGPGPDGGSARLAFGDLERLPYTTAVWKESLRFYPPVYLLAREAIAASRVGHVDLPRHSFMGVNIFGMHRSARYFDDPERFDPERFLGAREKAIPKGAYLPFGAGPRVCIGAHFATLTGLLTIATFARHARLEPVPGGAPTPRPLVTLRPDGLKMRVVRRTTRIGPPDLM